MNIFVSFYQSKAVVFSTFKNLVVEVLVSLSHWKDAAQIMVDRKQEYTFD
jgi:hypothetical protein